MSHLKDKFERDLFKWCSLRKNEVTGTRKYILIIFLLDFSSV